MNLSEVTSSHRLVSLNESFGIENIRCRYYQNIARKCSVEKRWSNASNASIRAIEYFHRVSRRNREVSLVLGFPSVPPRVACQKLKTYIQLGLYAVL